MGKLCLPISWVSRAMGKSRRAGTHATLTAEHGRKRLTESASLEEHGSRLVQRMDPYIHSNEKSSRSATDHASILPEFFFRCFLMTLAIFLGVLSLKPSSWKMTRPSTPMM